MLGGSFYTGPTTATLSQWTHVVCNFIGPNNGEGIELWIDGVTKLTSTTLRGYRKTKYGATAEWFWEDTTRTTDLHGIITRETWMRFSSSIRPSLSLKSANWPVCRTWLSHIYTGRSTIMFEVNWLNVFGTKIVDNWWMIISYRPHAYQTHLAFSKLQFECLYIISN